MRIFETSNGVPSSKKKIPSIMPIGSVEFNFNNSWSCLSDGDTPMSKPKYYPVTDSAKYCEGKVKRTPGGE